MYFVIRMDYFNEHRYYLFKVRNAHKLLNETGFRVEKVFYHLPKCRIRLAGTIEKMWNDVNWPFCEYLSTAYWIIASTLKLYSIKDYEFGWRWLLPLQAESICRLYGFSVEEEQFWRTAPLGLSCSSGITCAPKCCW